MMATRHFRKARRLLNGRPATGADAAGNPVGFVRRAQESGLGEVHALVRMATVLQALGVVLLASGRAATSTQAAS